LTADVNVMRQPNEPGRSDSSDGFKDAKPFLV
jgi:hypothetical protein